MNAATLDASAPPSALRGLLRQTGTLVRHDATFERDHLAEIDARRLTCSVASLFD